MAALLALGFATVPSVLGQTTFSESFTGTTAPGWIYGGNYTPNLTANSVDSPGNGWLRLTDNANNRATYALLDTQIFSVNAQIQIEMDYAFWDENGTSGYQTGGDGITFFLVDGTVTDFAPGGYGGSLGYAPLVTGEVNTPGMPGGYLGFGFDNWGNYAGQTEGRNGGLGTVADAYPNRVAVRGPESSNYAFLGASAPLETLPGGGQMDFPFVTSRPDQSGASYRSFRLTFDANNQLTVEMRFGASADYIEVFTTDLSAYERPETFKIGFTSGSGGATEIHEVRNVTLTSTPWSSGSGAYEWDNGDGTTTWGTSAGTEANANWFSSVSGDNNKTPTPGSDILFGSKPASGPQSVNLANNVEVRNLTFDTPYDYTLGGAGTITFGDAGKAGLPSINVNNYNESNANGRHKINNDLAIVENIAIRNFSYSTLCLNGDISLGANTLTTSGYGLTNLNGVITGSGPIVVNGSSSNPATGQGIVTLGNDNSSTYTGTITVNGGQLVALDNGALGTTGASTNQAINQDRSAGNTTVRVSSGVAGSLSVGQEVYGAGIAPGTVITSITGSGGNRTVTLSQALTANVTNGNSFAFVSPSAYTRVNAGGTLTLRDGITTGETLILNGTGATLGREEQTGALYNDGGDNTVSGAVILATGTAIGSRAGNLTLSGTVAGAGNLTKIGDGVLTLGNASNIYTGNTIIEGGALRISNNQTALPGGFATGGASGGNLALAGGVLEIGVATSFTRGVGAGADQVQWTGDGGFSAFDATTPGLTRTVTLGSSLVWGSGSFIQNNHALLLSSDYANGTLNFTNAINLGGAMREIRVANGSAVVDGQLSGVLSNGGIDKTGAGTLSLTANNTYAGATRISAGALRYTNDNQIDGSNLQLNGGVLEIGNSNFSRSLGTGTSAVQWLGDGGFAAFNGSARTVTLGTGTRTWGETNFIGLDNRLIFGSVSANNTASLQNALALGNDAGTRTIHTVAGTSSLSAVASGTLSGIVSGSATLAVTGNGRLDLTAANSFTGPLTVTGSEVRLGGTAGTLTGGIAGAGVTSITVRQGGTLSIDNTATTDNSLNRVRNDAAISLQGGTLNLLGRTGDNNTAETIGAVTLSSGANTINVQRGDANGSAQLTAASLTRTAGSTVDFTNASGGGALGSTGDNPRAVFTAAPTQTNGILAYATVNGTAFATHDATNGVAAITPDFVSTFTAALNAGQDTTTGLGGATDRQVNSITFTTGNLDLSARNLDIVSGGLLSTGSTASTINGAGTLTSSSGELITHVYGSGGFTIASRITDSGATSVAFTKSGDGNLTFSGATNNTYTGVTTVNAGTLVLAKSDDVVSVAGDLVIGDGRGIDTVRLDANEQIADTATVSLRGGEVGNAANVARLELDGAANDTFGSRIESFTTLSIVGNTILDFGGGTPCSPTFLYLDFLDVAADSLLTITNWIEFTDFLLVAKDTFTSEDLGRVIFDGYGGAASWKDYDSNYYQIIPYAPVPEPAAYGLLSLGGLAGFALLRRRRRDRRGTDMADCRPTASKPVCAPNP